MAMAIRKLPTAFSITKPADSEETTAEDHGTSRFHPVITLLDYWRA